VLGQLFQRAQLLTLNAVAVPLVKSRIPIAYRIELLPHTHVRADSSDSQKPNQILVGFPRIAVETVRSNPQIETDIGVPMPQGLYASI